MRLQLNNKEDLKMDVQTKLMERPLTQLYLELSGRELKLASEKEKKNGSGCKRNS